MLSEILKQVSEGVKDLSVSEAIEAFHRYWASSKYTTVAYPYSMTYLNLTTSVGSIKVIDGTVFLIAKKSSPENWILGAFPLHYELVDNEEDWIRMMMSNRIPVFAELNQLTSLCDCMELEFNDEYVYPLSDLNLSWVGTSRQSGKSFRRLSNSFLVAVRKITDIDEHTVSAMHEVTEAWFHTLRKEDSKYLWNKDIFYNYLETLPEEGLVVTYHDKSSGEVKAWDYVELHCNTLVLIAGHSAISGSFKFITYNLAKVAESLGARYANIGRTAIFKGRHVLTDRYEIHPTTIAVAKAYFPHKVQYTMHSVPKIPKEVPREIKNLF